MKSEKSKDGGAEKRQAPADKNQQKSQDFGKDMQHSKTPKSKSYLEDEDDEPRSNRNQEGNYDSDSEEGLDAGQSGRDKTKNPDSGKPGRKH